MMRHCVLVPALMAILLSYHATLPSARVVIAEFLKHSILLSNFTLLLGRLRWTRLSSS